MAHAAVSGYSRGLGFDRVSARRNSICLKKVMKTWSPIRRPFFYCLVDSSGNFTLGTSPILHEQWALRPAVRPLERDGASVLSVQREVRPLFWHVKCVAAPRDAVERSRRAGLDGRCRVRPLAQRARRGAGARGRADLFREERALRLALIRRPSRTHARPTFAKSAASVLGGSNNQCLAPHNTQQTC